MLDFHLLKTEEASWHLDGTQKARIIQQCLQPKRRTRSFHFRPLYAPLVSAAAMSLAVLTVLLLWPRSTPEQRATVAGSKAEPASEATASTEPTTAAAGQAAAQKIRQEPAYLWETAATPTLLGAYQSYQGKIKDSAALSAPLTDSMRKNLYQFYKFSLSAPQVALDYRAEDFPGFTLDLLIDPAWNADQLLGAYPLSDALEEGFTATQAFSAPSAANYKGLSLIPIRLTVQLQKDGAKAAYQDAMPEALRLVRYYLSCAPVRFAAINTAAFESLAALEPLVYSESWKNQPDYTEQEAQAYRTSLVLSQTYNLKNVPFYSEPDTMRKLIFTDNQKILDEYLNGTMRRFGRYCYYEGITSAIGENKNLSLSHYVTIDCDAPAMLWNTTLLQDIQRTLEADGIYTRYTPLGQDPAYNAPTNAHGRLVFQFYTDAAMTQPVSYETALSLLSGELAYYNSCTALLSVTPSVPAIDYANITKEMREKIDSYAD